MFYQVVMQCAQSLKNIETCLDKAEEFAAAKKFSVDVLITSRLAPDMRNFIYQVQSASDYLKGAASWLSGRMPPKYEDDEQTIQDVRERIAKTTAYLKAIDAGTFEGADTRVVTIKQKDLELKFSGVEYLFQFGLPNFYFHIVTAYDILRHLGVPVGKMDFLGPLQSV